MRTRVKICCISSVEEAKIAINAGADALGLVGPMPSGPGIITNELISEIARFAPPAIGSFLLTSETDAVAIAEHHRKVHTTTIQIVDSLKSEDYTEIRALVGPVKLVQVIHVLNESSIEEALRVAQHVDALLLDSGNPNLQVKELGGTGRVHNWALSRRIVDASPVPVFLAGGLNAGNVREAMETVRPFGVDVCSGVRTDGKLDPQKVEQFFRAVYS
jgi:phosphoribosylanthranilate isomerase